MTAAEGSGQLALALDKARSRASQAALATGRRPETVKLMLATKTQPAALIRQAIALGFTLIGENRVQELVSKAPVLADLPHRTHLIGPLQSNKINAALRHVECVETVASLGLAEQLSRRSTDRPEPLEVMVQVNTSGEPTKSGCQPAQAADLAAMVGALPGLRLVGFMTVGLNSPDAGAVLGSYLALRVIRDQVVASGEAGTAEARELSMGMSGDLELAVQAGATIVRLGTAVFGPRAPAT